VQGFQPNAKRIDAYDASRFYSGPPKLTRAKVAYPKVLAPFYFT